MSLEGSVTTNLARLKRGDRSAVDPLWRRFFPWLVGLARRKLPAHGGGAADGEDVALEAFSRFCQRAEQGRLADVHRREEVRRLLVTMTVQMAIDEIRRERRQKRGGAALAAEHDMPGAMLAGDCVTQAVISRDPPPDLAMQVAEACERLLSSLDDDELKAIAVWKSEGCTNEEIARKLGVVLRTVERKLHLVRARWAGDTPPAMQASAD